MRVLPRCCSVDGVDPRKIVCKRLRLRNGESQRMDQGWETARNPNRPSVLGVGSDGMLDLPASMAEWAIIRLAREVVVEEVSSYVWLSLAPFRLISYVPRFC